MADRSDAIGPLLVRLRQARGWSQLRIAEMLCGAAGTSTVTRHEVSRWEREQRIPGAYWRGWLAVVLDVPPDVLETAVVRGSAATTHCSSSTGGERCAPTAGDLLATLDADRNDLRELAHAWLADPPDAAERAGRPVRSSPGPGAADPTLLADLRRADDLVGGADLAARVDRELRSAATAVQPGRHHRHRLRLVADFAQLAGWVHADAGDPGAARRAHRVGLRAAAAAGDRPLAAHVLGSLSHQQLAAGDPPGALLLARTAYTGARRSAPAPARALLLHRVALAAARAGERRAAHAALHAAEKAAEKAAERARPDQEPPWLYWLDPAELRAMTGRCLVVLGRPVRAAALLAAPRVGTGPRTAALYAGWLARAYLDLGEVELACEVAAGAWPDVIRSGSVRVAATLRRLDPVLRPHRDLPVVRGYTRFATVAAGYLPRPRAAPRPSAAAR